MHRSQHSRHKSQNSTSNTPRIETQQVTFLTLPLGHEATDTRLAYTPCHRRMVISTLSSMFCLAALQRRPNQCRMPLLGHEATDTGLA